MDKIGSYSYLAKKDAIRAQQMYDLGDYSACGKFCEQSVEKILKSFLEVNGNASDQPLMTLHKPKRLYDRCCELGLDTKDLILSAKLAIFSDYYYDTNYPGNAYFELDEEQAKEALSIMDTVLSLVAYKE